MTGNDPFSRLAQQFGERLQDASRAPEEIQRTVQGAMRSAFERMELVTREDFDILMDVLQRTRSRVEALEKQVGALEAALDDKNAMAASPALVAADSVAPPAPDSETHSSTFEKEDPSALIDTPSTQDSANKSSSSKGTSTKNATKKDGAGTTTARGTDGSVSGKPGNTTSPKK